MNIQLETLIPGNQHNINDCVNVVDNIRLTLNLSDLRCKSSVTMRVDIHLSDDKRECKPLLYMFSLQYKAVNVTRTIM